MGGVHTVHTRIYATILPCGDIVILEYMESLLSLLYALLNFLLQLLELFLGFFISLLQLVLNFARSIVGMV
jgi:hypothetical protein